MPDQPIDNSYLPPSFGEALADNYLGSPRVVARLLKDYCDETWTDLHARSQGTLSADEGTVRFKVRASALARILGGEDPAYQPIAGWNSIRLKCRVRSVLCSYWDEQRARYDDDAFMVLGAYLVWLVFETMKKVNDGEDQAEAEMAQAVDVLVRVLLGTEPRA